MIRISFLPFLCSALLLTQTGASGKEMPSPYPAPGTRRAPDTAGITGSRPERTAAFRRTAGSPHPVRHLRQRGTPHEFCRRQTASRRETEQGNRRHHRKNQPSGNLFLSRADKQRPWQNERNHHYPHRTGDVPDSPHGLEQLVFLQRRREPGKYSENRPGCSSVPGWRNTATAMLTLMIAGKAPEAASTAPSSPTSVFRI